MAKAEGGVIAGSPRLTSLAGRPRPAPVGGEAQPAVPGCEMCAEPIAGEHRHTLDLESRRVLCVCRACAILLDRDAAGGGHYRLIPTRRLRLERFRLEDHTWASLRIPVDLAFFFSDGSQQRVRAFYPSPMGPTESQLTLDTWTDLEEGNPILGEMADDVEALLVDRSGENRRYWIVPIDDCYRLVGVMRIHWKGLAGGKEVWDRIEGFFEDLTRDSRPAVQPAGEPQGG